jgi:hypothetical protein
VLLRTHAQETAEGHYGIGNPAADLLDHEAFDAADIIALRIIDGRAFHSVALDQRLSGHHSLLDHGCLLQIVVWLDNAFGPAVAPSAEKNREGRSVRSAFGNWLGCRLSLPPRLPNAAGGATAGPMLRRNSAMAVSRRRADRPLACPCPTSAVFLQASNRATYRGLGAVVSASPEPLQPRSEQSHAVDLRRSEPG